MVCEFQGRWLSPHSLLHPATHLDPGILFQWLGDLAQGREGQRSAVGLQRSNTDGIPGDAKRGGPPSPLELLLYIDMMQLVLFRIPSNSKKIWEECKYS
jgi:hypothetical protein